MKMMFEEKLDDFLAKSDGTTIKKHIDDLLEQFERFFSIYPDFLNENEKELLRLAIKYHDYGKLNNLFQKKLKSSKKRDDKVPHQYLSPIFLRRLENNLEFEALAIIIYAIINHHARGRKKYLNPYGIILLLREIENNITEFFKDLGIKSLSEETKNFYIRYLEYIINNISNLNSLNKQLKEDKEFIKRLIKISGLLIKIDHSASGKDLVIEEEPIPKNREKFFLTYLEKNGKQAKLRPFQKKFKDFENLVVVADTGLGKTGLATIWSKRKMFYVLPNRASTNAMFETMKKIFGKKKVGLLHSTSLFYVYSNSENEDYTILRDYEITKNLAKPITISTADQLFVAVFKYPTYEKIYTTLSYSDIVIDEIQGFAPEQIVPILRQIEETKKLGARYLIITATLPQIVKEELQKLGFSIKVDDPATIDNTKRHKIKILEKDIFSVKDEILKKAKENKNVLVIVNTVSTAQELYKHLKGNANLLHSRFIWKTRKEKEEKIRQAYLKKGVIWITTQLVEASLDIDFDVLFTEVATADSLIQRMGRIWRWRNKDYSYSEPNIYILSKVDEKKTGQIYEKVLRDESLKLIKQNLSKDGFLLSKEKRKIVEVLYSKKNLEKLGSEYIKKWKKIENILNLGWETLLKKEAHNIFRDTFTFEAIPYKYKKEAEELSNKLEKLLKDKNKSFEEKKLEKIKILKELNDIKVPVPIYYVLKKDKGKINKKYTTLNADYNINILNESFEYDDEIGLLEAME